MMTEIMQRTPRDWAIYVDGDYRGTVTRIANCQRPFVCTHTLDHFDTRDEAIAFLEKCDRYYERVNHSGRN
jgi:hypothetical protein